MGSGWPVSSKPLTRVDPCLLRIMCRLGLQLPPPLPNLLGRISMHARSHRNSFAVSGERQELDRPLPSQSPHCPLELTVRAETITEFWRQIWRVAGKESGSLELLERPQTSQKFPELPRKFFGDFPGTSLWGN